MDRYHDNSYGSADASRSASRVRTVRLSNPSLGKIGDSPAAQTVTEAKDVDTTGRAPRRPAAARPIVDRRTAAPAREEKPGRASARSAASQDARPPRNSKRASARQRRPASNVMKYAQDNRAVQAVYNFTHGATKPLFIVLVVIAVLAGIYGPVRDYYSAYRTGDILNRQLELVKSYNADLQGEVDTLLSREGIEDTARKELNLVMPGEKTLTVTGDGGSSDEGSSGSDASSTITADELEKKMAAVVSDSPWYIKVLDTLFGYSGPEGQASASASTKASE